MFDENIISNLEQSLRQTRNFQRRLIEELRKVEDEAHRLRDEIQALEQSAEQTSNAITSILATMRSSQGTSNLRNSIGVADDYEIPKDIRRRPQMSASRDDDSGQWRTDYEPRISSTYSRGGDVYDDDGGRRVPSIKKDLEPHSSRFADRTITQACTLLLRESSQPLHVNELYNLLVSGGFQFTGQNPTISIAVSLNRNSRFKKVAPGTFDLVMRAAS
ncbi:MAG: hypothetical protein ACK5NT_15890 [Pyrinomonadaceae bacterium]